MLAASSATHAAGGPTFAGMSTSPDALFPPSSSPSPSERVGGVLGDVLDDFGIELPVKTTSKLEPAPSRPTIQGHTMDDSQKRGVYTLVGILFSAWLVSGLAAPSKPEKSTKKNGEVKNH